MKAMILAAGEGTRLRPLTLTRPKPMLPIAGKPVLEHSIAWLRAYGVDHIVINLHHQPAAVTEYFGDGARLGIDLTYSIEPVILGTAGGVKNVARLFDDTFVIVYGDVLTDFDLKRLVDDHQARPGTNRLTMSLYCVPNPTECGIVALDDAKRIVRFVEKPRREDVFSDLASAGVLVIDPALLDLIPEQTFYDFGHDLFPRLLDGHADVYGWPLPDDAYLIDVGTPDKLEQARREWPTAAARRFLDGATS